MKPFEWYAALGWNTNEPYVLNQLKHPYRLVTYAYPDKARASIEHSMNGSKIIVDSGAFTAYTQGIPLSLEAYARYCKQLLVLYPQHSFEFMNMDVIGDQEKSNDNHAKLADMGITTTPIYTNGANLKHLESMMKFPRVALGGLVPLTRKPKELDQALTEIFAVAASHPDIHLLGITQHAIALRYPIASCDSKTWSGGVWSNSGKNQKIREQVSGKPSGKLTREQKKQVLTLQAQEYIGIQEAIRRHRTPTFATVPAVK